MSSETTRTSARMPVVFAGHGSPMNAIEDNRWSRGFRALADGIPRPRAILAISAHWYTRATYLTDNPAPETIHDFSGFPRALHEVSYPARGSVDLAEQVRDLLAPDASLRSDWGLDHGTWSVLRWMYPDADVPVVQLSLNRRLREPAHYELGRSLAELRDDGVLIVGSGNIVHNLGDAFSHMHSGDPTTPAWAAEFDRTVADAVEQRDTDALLSLWSNTDLGKRAHPIPDHWLPLIYTLGATDDRDQLRFENQGFDLGSISMRSIVWS